MEDRISAYRGLVGRPEGEISFRRLMFNPYPANVENRASS
jgi:hypothetical protein